MLTFLRSRTRGRLITLLLVGLFAVGATCLTVLALRGHSGARNRAVHRPASTGPAAPPPVKISAPPQPTRTAAPLAAMLPQTRSADVYAAAVAKALWDVDYATTSRAAVLAFWRAQLSPVLPAGTPPGTTLAQAQSSAMSTLVDLIPSAGMWSTLAGEHTASSFTVTGVTEPPGWIEAVSSGRIIDPGLTAREVIGVQRISYQAGGGLHATAQTQQLLIAMLCPPTTRACRVEVFPPQGTSGASG